MARYTNGAILAGALNVFVDGHYAYIAAQTNDSVEILDVSNPRNPTLVRSYKSANLNDTFDVFISGNYLYITSSANDLLEIVDISNPRNPYQVAVVQPNGLNGDLDYASDLFLQGNYAYVTARNNNSMQIIDVSNVMEPTSTARYQPGDLLAPHGIFVSGNYAYVVARDNVSLEIIDIVSSTNPVSVATFTNSALAAPQDIFVQGNYAYVVSPTGNSLNIIDISGTSISNAEIGTARVSNLTVDSFAQFDQNVTIRGGLQTGGGIAAYGPSSIYGGLTIASSTATSVTTTPQLLVKGSADFTPNIFEWQNSAGTILGLIGSTGGLIEHASSTFSKPLNIHGLATMTASTTFAGTADGYEVLTIDNYTVSSTATRWDWDSGAAGNTVSWYFPRLSGGSCGTGQAEGIIFKTTQGTQVGHACIEASGTDQLKWYAQAFNTTATDVAENYSDPDNMLEPGDVVSLDTRTIDNPAPASILKSTTPYERTLLGVISERPGILLSGISEQDGSTDLRNPKPVALSGRIPVKVTSKNGTIKTGDYLTSSAIPGIAQKATMPGPVLGRALTTYVAPDDQIGTVIVFIKPEWWQGPYEDDTGNTDLLPQVRDETFHNLTVRGTLDIAGNEIVNIGRLSGLNENWSIDEDGTIITKSTIAQRIDTSDGSQAVYGVSSPDVEITLSGSSVLSNGSAFVNILDVPGGKLFSESVSERGLKVFVTATSRSYGVYVKEKSLTGFVIEELGGGQSSATFDWIFVGIKKGHEQKVEEEVIEETTDSVVEVPFVDGGEASVEVIEVIEDVPVDTVPAEPESGTVDETVVETIPEIDVAANTPEPEVVVDPPSVLVETLPEIAEELPTNTVPQVEAPVQEQVQEQEGSSI